MTVERILLATAVVAAAGCLPSRNNDRDPNNRPQARLLAVDNTAEDGSCSSDFGPTQTWTAVTSALRSACLALDARLTTDPQGGGLDALSFEFGSTDAAGGFAALPPAAIVSVEGEGGSAVVLDAEWVRSLPVGQSISFAVRVTDASDAESIGGASLVLRNTRPVAVARKTRTLPVGGYPWTPGEPFTVTFDGSGSYDPDGDELSFCWTFPGEAPACGTSPAATRELPSTQPGRYVATLVVSDGDAALPSHPVASAVRIEAPNVFLQSRVTFDDSGLVAPLDANVHLAPTIDFGDPSLALALPAGPSGFPRVARVESGPESFGASGTAQLSIAPLPAMEPPGDLLEIASYRLVMARSTQADRLFAATLSLDTPGQALLQTISIEGDDELMLEDGGIPITGTLYDPDLIGVGLQLEVDELDQRWVAARSPVEASDISVIGDQGLVATLSTAPVYLTVVDLASRTPLAGQPPEMWALGRPVQGHPEVGTWLIALDPEAPATGPRGYPIAVGFASDIAWASRNLLWLSTQDQGLLLIDVELLETVGFDGAVLHRIDEARNLRELLVDGKTGSVRGRGPSPVTGDDALWEAWTDGSARSQPLYAFPFSPIPHAVDGDGALLATAIGFDGSYFVRGLSLEGGARAPFPVAISADLLPDFTDGGVWVPEKVFGQSALTRRDPDGMVLETIAELDYAGEGAAPFPLPSYAAISLDGKTLWMFDEIYVDDAALLRIDMTARPPIAHRVPIDPAVAYDLSYLAFSGRLFAPLLPSSGNTSSFWILSGTDLNIVSGTGQVDSVLTLLDNEGSLASGSLFPATNELCIATISAGSPKYHVRRVSPDGGNTLLASLPESGLSTENYGIAFGDECWSVFADGNALFSPTQSHVRIHAWTAPGTVRRSIELDVDGRVTSAAVVSPEQIWLTVSDPDGHMELARIDFGPMSGTTGGTVTYPMQAPIAGRLMSVGSRASGSD